MKVSADIMIEHHGNPKGKGEGHIVMKCKVKDREVQRCYRVDTEDTTKNELALMTVIAALRKLTKPCEVTIKINSPYVKNQIRNLKNWETRGWSRAAGRELKNKQLWQQLQMLRKIHKIDFKEVKNGR